MRRDHGRRHRRGGGGGGGGGNNPQHGGQHPQHGGGGQQGQQGGGNRQGGNQQHGNQHHGNRPPRQHHRQHHGNSQPRTPIATFELDPAFRDKTPITPKEWIQLEKGLDNISMRTIDLLAPIGKGQRGLIVAPPKAGKTTLLKNLAQAVLKAEPTMKVYCLLVDERPEEVTEFRREVAPAEVHASSNDRTFDEHVQVAEKVFKQAVQEAGAGADVLILLDSLTRLSRVHNAFATGNRTMSGGLDSRAMEVPRKFFGAARKLEEGGSLTILATILVNTGSKMDEVIFQEFKGTGNMELVLSRSASEQRLFPAIDVRATGTRKEELLLPPDYLQGVWKLRRALASLGEVDATRQVIELVKRHPTNRKLIDAVNQP